MTDLRESGAVRCGELVDDRYLVQERIGEGGMGCVYRAEDTHLHRTVAMKVFRTSAEGLGSVERALSETTILASLNHHALVTVYDARVSADDISYLVMEHVDGITLGALMARGPLDLDTVAAIAIDVAEGLHSAHDAGVVHRDIKPSNVLVSQTALPGRPWRAKVADFGIAYLVDSTRVTRPGLLVGTAAYVAPEQARGAPPAPPADIYAFGLMLLEALTGRRPFAEAEGIGTVVARLERPPEVPDTLPAPWRGLLRGMTAVRADDRPTASEIAVTLSALIAAERADSRLIADEPTMPYSPPGIAAPLTSPTALLAGPSQAATGSDASGSRSDAVPGAGGPRRRRRAIGAIAAAAVVTALVGAVWISALPDDAAQPSPTRPAIQQEPSPTPSDEPPAAPQDGTGGNGDSGPANDNSGPGNNNGNGNGNGNGPGNNNGNGNGNGPGNNNGNGND